MALFSAGFADLNDEKNYQDVILKQGFMINPFMQVFSFLATGIKMKAVLSGAASTEIPDKMITDIIELLATQ
jgi:hypothetical protein